VIGETSDKLPQVPNDGKRVERERDQQDAVAREQAHLLELAHDSIIVRDLENRITFWNHGAEVKYGWTRQEAIGQSAHNLLKTQFSQPLDQVEETLQRDHYWEGQIIRTRKDGQKIVVASRRVLQCDAEGKPTAILEINNDITPSSFISTRQMFMRKLISA
jgi:PAS domain S-box-containing protein